MKKVLLALVFCVLSVSVMAEVVKLDVSERLVVINLCPQKGDMVTLSVVKDIVAKLEITPKEKKDLKFVTEGNQIRWNAEKGEELVKEFEFTNAELGLLKNKITDLDSQNNISLGMFDVIKKIQSLKNVNKDTTTEE